MKFMKTKEKTIAKGMDMGSVISAKAETISHSMVWVVVFSFLFLFGNSIPFGIFLMFVMFTNMYYMYNRAVDRSTLATSHLVIGNLVTTILPSMGRMTIPPLYDSAGKQLMPEFSVFVGKCAMGGGPIPPVIYGKHSQNRFIIIVPKYAIEDVDGRGQFFIVRGAKGVVYSDSIPHFEISKLNLNILAMLRAFQPPFNIPPDTSKTLVYMVRTALPVPDVMKEIIHTMQEAEVSKAEIQATLKSLTASNTALIESDLNRALDEAFSIRAKESKARTPKEQFRTEKEGETEGGNEQ